MKNQIFRSSALLVVTLTAVVTAVVTTAVGAAQASSSQSTLPPSQLRGTASANGQIYLVTPSGSVALGDIGDNLVIDMSSGRPVLKAVVPQVTTPTTRAVVGEVLAADASSALSFTLKATPVSGTVVVYRNGLRQTSGVDYQIRGSNILFIPYYASSTGDLIVADYSVALP